MIHTGKVFFPYRFFIHLFAPFFLYLFLLFSFSNKCRKYIWFHMQTTQACYTILIQICICLMKFETVARLFTSFSSCELKAQTVCWILILFASQHRFYSDRSILPPNFVRLSWCYEVLSCELQWHNFEIQERNDETHCLIRHRQKEMERKNCFHSHGK